VVVTPRVERVRMRAEELRTPGPLVPGARRIAVLRNDRLGDFVLTVPAIAAVRAAYPDAFVGLVVAPAVASLARRVRGIDAVAAADRSVRDMSQALRGLAPDVVIAISRGAGAASAVARSGARHRIGVGLRVYSPLFTRRVSERRRAGGRHEVEYALSFAHRAGAPAGAARFPFVPDPEAERDVEHWLGERGIGRGFVVVHPGSGGSCPRWPISHFLELRERLEADGVRTVVTVGPGDDEVASALAGSGSEPFRFRVENLAALVRRAALVVSNSTAPVHLAAAQGTPALALHAPWSSCGVSRWGPYHPSGAGVVAVTAGAERWTRAARRTRGASLLAAVSPVFVHRTICELYPGEAS